MERSGAEHISVSIQLDGAYFCQYSTVRALYASSTYAKHLPTGLVRIDGA